MVGCCCRLLCPPPFIFFQACLLEVAVQFGVSHNCSFQRPLPETSWSAAPSFSSASAHFGCKGMVGLFSLSRHFSTRRVCQAEPSYKNQLGVVASSHFSIHVALSETWRRAKGVGGQYRRVAWLQDSRFFFPLEVQHCPFVQPSPPPAPHNPTPPRL